ncbi:MAG TPA: type II toxin-antitoxin system YoeB family toxin [Candidatus Obscuribacterales bacterium]
MSRRIVFESSAFEDFTEWSKLDKKIYRKIVELIKDIERSPFEGLTVNSCRVGRKNALNFLLSPIHQPGFSQNLCLFNENYLRNQVSWNLAVDMP